MPPTTFTLGPDFDTRARASDGSVGPQGRRPSFSQQLAQLPLPDLRTGDPSAGCVTFAAPRTLRLHDCQL